MEVNTTYDIPNNLIRFEVRGQLDLTGLLQYARRATDHPDFRAGMNSIWDLLQADYHHLKFDEIQVSGDQIRADRDLRGKAKVAIVVNDELGHGLSRSFEAFSGMEHLEYQITPSVPEAMAWLELAG